MTYVITLGLHLATAALTGAVILYALYAVLRGHVQMYRSIALALAGVAAFEVFSGTVLAITSPDLSATALSLHILEYLGVCAVVEAALFAKMRNIALVYPTRLVLSPVIASVALFALTISLGF
ncbi:MAG TPA: hypothetical protein VHD31_02885 [Candidatus Paceibacterota bacterium]|nr:hypothetical protein [Candidatus Paceibacterota bacterium]